MIPSPFTPGSRLAGKRGLADRIFAGPRSRALLSRVDAGLARVEANLDRELSFGDALADPVGRYLYEAGGKRVRPMLTLLTAQLGSGLNDRVVDGATALELTHLGSLYHDDVMDAADTRRGVPSAQTVWGNNVAILTGDLLFSRASQLMARCGTRAIQLQADTFERLVLGQLHETMGPGEGDDPVSFYLQVLADKTGALIAAAARSGIIFSGAPEEFEDVMAEFGEKAGVAFQLLDDVIDLSADAAETGKVPGTDLRAGVPTMPLLLLGQSDSADARALRTSIDDGLARIADGADPALLDEPLARLRDHDATARTLDLAHSWAREAIDALAPLPRSAVREALTRFAEAVADRSS